MDEEAWEGQSRYAYLSYRYNQSVDDPDDAGETGNEDLNSARTAERRSALASLHAAIRAAQPMATAKLAQPRAIEGPLFAEFGRAGLVVLRNPAALDARALEQAIARLAANQLTIVGSRTAMAWRDHREGGSDWRELELPALGRRVGYGLRGGVLVVSNSPDLLARLMKNDPPRDSLAAPEPLHELTVIRLTERAAAFDRIFARLDQARVQAYWRKRKGDEAAPAEASREFFSGEIASLLDVAAPAAKVRIQRNLAGGRMREELTVSMK
jgi:hypothetical protein